MKNSSVKSYCKSTRRHREIPSESHADGLDLGAKRIRWAVTCAALLVTIILSSLAFGRTLDARSDRPSYSGVRSSIQRACSFLLSLYNNTQHLVRDTPLSHTYYVSSDNLLAQAALARCDPVLSQSINTAIGQNPCCNKGNDLMHEAILGTQIPLPIHNATTTNVSIYWQPGTGNTILYENHNGSGILLLSSYADIAVYTALEQDRSGNHTGTSQTVQVLNNMWDANGLVDNAFKNGKEGEAGVYQTFKDALYLLILLETSQAMPANLEQKILDMQGPDGGFNTGYYPNETYAGRFENAETTSIVMLALEALLPPESWYESYWYLFLIPIVSVTVLLFLVPSLRPFRSRPKTSLPPMNSGNPTAIKGDRHESNPGLRPEKDEDYA